MPRRRKTYSKRAALPAAELEARIMRIVQDVARGQRFKGISIVYVKSLGREPNWFAHPLPQKISDACKHAFVVALGRVRREFDLSIELQTPTSPLADQSLALPPTTRQKKLGRIKKTSAMGQKR
jgi:hypothetical protein